MCSGPIETHSPLVSKNPSNEGGLPWKHNQEEGFCYERAPPSGQGFLHLWDWEPLCSVAYFRNRIFLLHPENLSQATSQESSFFILTKNTCAWDCTMLGCTNCASLGLWPSGIKQGQCHTILKF